MSSQLELARIFHELHNDTKPLVLINAWDAGTAQTVQEAGSQAIATGSWSVAAAHGYEDGERLPFELVLANLQRIVRHVNLPVTIDIEGGYGASPELVKENVAKVIEAGAVGINLEDQLPDGSGLYAIEEQCLRIAAAREAAERTGIPLFINARTDIFFQAPPSTHETDHVEDALRRAQAYAPAGANGIFVPGLGDAKLIEALCRQSAIPVNIMISSHTPEPRQLAELGVARISYGPLPYLRMMSALKAASVEALALHKFE